MSSDPSIIKLAKVPAGATIESLDGGGFRIIHSDGMIDNVRLIYTESELVFDERLLVGDVWLTSGKGKGRGY